MECVLSAYGYRVMRVCVCLCGSTYSYGLAGVCVHAELEERLEPECQGQFKGPKITLNWLN